MSHSTEYRNEDLHQAVGGLRDVYGHLYEAIQTAEQTGYLRTASNLREMAEKINTLISEVEATEKQTRLVVTTALVDQAAKDAGETPAETRRRLNLAQADILNAEYEATR